MVVHDRREGAAVAAALLRVDVDELYAHSIEVPEIDAFFYWQPIRGGAHLLVARDGSVLFAISSLALADMIEPFRNGRRTDPALFDRWVG